MISRPLTLDARRQGCVTGLLIGDALAMPAHWYYRPGGVNRDYGIVDEYRTPRNPHPDSILWRSSYKALTPETDILHDQAQYWGQPNIHYHQFLAAGENTLNLQLCLKLLESLTARDVYDPDHYVKQYIEFMTTPGRHRDTYVEECHRNFFTNLALGKPPSECGVTEKHIGGLVSVPVLAAWYADDPASARRSALQHVALTHPGPRMAEGVRLFAQLFELIYRGMTLRDALRSVIDRWESAFVDHPFVRWLPLSDEQVIGRRLSPACYLEDAVPAVLYLALKYSRQPAVGLRANVHVGGDNAHRGALLGALFGAAHGCDGFPPEWIDGLRFRETLDDLMPQVEPET